ncbi:hypothetical protein [Clostridium saccharobutylicum]|uniref:Uncharacterized protein n=1 Tax=Clostridium saccharobutylicum DSM 13864 TaxID=1345695 RepID=U5MS55_CLOSA|nr:hypothetical protein [Clostridium saccharobutylicum]AGX42466.1 hypothetical protein CLSA_c14660 [Clostridium saccharobutylicum DSM 13864]AQR89751.1 hypothetical protein CLOSC_14540 [Clostridium saccharobutylicum]AQR99653.1 hypothetical protein CSACC_14620 [Clostridium saccharobutylicum]AQS09384.1 hypothetical protein CLOBY_15110 [Clostridium saccharobutylicum]AQS13639.1 hypothetical protein CLOSACC_14620 [Clostridium saccharobutylicum]
MNINNKIIKVINDNLATNSEFEFIAELGDLTLADIYYIEKISTINSIKEKFNYQIIDNTYIKINYSC